MEQRPAVQSNEAVPLFRLPNVFFYRDERTQIGSRFLLDTSLSSSPFLANSTRHSVTSRIECNSRAFCHLIFSTRHLNATLENHNNVEKFNTRLRFLVAPDPSCKPTKWKVEKPRSEGSATCRKQQDTSNGCFRSGDDL
jgi:hypothetical protein